MKTITIELPVTINQKESGLLFLRSPLIKGLLVSAHTEEELAAKAQEAISGLSLVAEA